MTFEITKHYQAPTPSLWQGRADSAANERFFQVVKQIDLNRRALSELEPGLAIIGFACDEGVKRNLGRIGAAQGPDELKQQLAKLPIFSTPHLYDLGNITCLDQDLEQAQIKLGQLIDNCHQNNLKTLVLGGGHETAWGHYLGLKPHYPDLGIINFDAHFDLRNENRSTSGTPFLQIAHDKQALEQSFDYLCYGIQQTANTASLFETAEQLDVKYLTNQHIHSQSLSWSTSEIEDFINLKNHLYISICLDVFSAAIAPGVSAPQPLGLLANEVLPILELIMKSEKVMSIDIVELNPKYDVNQITAKLASQLAAEVVYGLTSTER